MQNYVTLNEVVKSHLIDIGETTEHLYQRCLHFAFDGLKDLHFDTVRQVKTVKLTMSEAKTIPLPNDYVNYVKVGLVFGDRVKTILVNNKIEKFHDVDECGNPAPKATEGFLNGFPVGITTFGGYFFNNYLGGSFYGFGGTCYIAGYCTVDKARGEILFASEVENTDVYLEYITNGINPSGDSVIDPFAAKALKWYISWQRKQNSRQYSMSDKEQARMLYYNELRLVQARMNNFTIEDIVAATKKGYLDRLEAHPRLNRNDNSTTGLTDTKEEPCDTFPVDEVDVAPIGTKKIYWGAKASPLIDTKEEIHTLVSDFFTDRLITKTVNAEGGKYIYFAYPVAYGEGVFIFNTFETTFLEVTVSDFEDDYVSEPYYVYRSIQLQHSNSLTVEIT